MAIFIRKINVTSVGLQHKLHERQWQELQNLMEDDMEVKYKPERIINELADVDEEEWDKESAKTAI